MRRFITAASCMAFATNAGAQDVDPDCQIPLCNYTVTVTGNWKVSNPSGPSDWWNSFKAGDCSGSTVTALIANFGETAGIAGSHAELGIYPDLGAGVPDITNPIARHLNPVVAANEQPEDAAGYSIPSTTLGSAGYHVAAKYVNGDSHTWMGADNSANRGRTFFTTTSYGTGALPYGIEIAMHFGTPLPGGSLLINGANSASVTQLQEICLFFFGPALNTQFALYFCINGSPVLQLAPLSITVTDGLLVGPCPQSWELCTTLDCDAPTGSGFEFCTIYTDQTDLKPNGKPKLKFGASAFLDITPARLCPDGACYGQKDDCVMEGTLWKMTNAAGPSDWFNVNHGVPTPGVTSLTSVSLASWDFCGFGPCWAEVGIYGSNLGLDPTGQTPDLNNPIAVVSGASACMPPGAAETDCAVTGFTLYDTVDVPAPSSNLHVAVRWTRADSCIWLGGDTDGTDSSCGIPIRSDGSHSLFTLDSYSTAAVPFSGGNWMMQIDWN